MTYVAFIFILIVIPTGLGADKIIETSQNDSLVPQMFLYDYLDDWIIRINKSVSSSDLHPLSTECHNHLTMMLEAGKSRMPWALKSEFVVIVSLYLSPLPRDVSYDCKTCRSLYHDFACL